MKANIRTQLYVNEEVLCSQLSLNLDDYVNVGWLRSQLRLMLYDYINVGVGVIETKSKTQSTM